MPISIFSVFFSARYYLALLSKFRFCSGIRCNLKLFSFNPQKKIGFAAASFLIVSLSSLSALPTPPSLEEMVRDSEYIAKVKLSKIREKKISGGDLSVTCVGEVLEAYKTPSPMPARLDLAFMVLPNVYGKWLKATPKEGEYILFFINKVVKDSKGNLINVVSLYEPNPFAIHEYTKEYEGKVRKALK